MEKGWSSDWALKIRNQMAKDFYEQLRKGASARKLVEEFIIPKETGKGCILKKGQILRVIEIEDKQIADFNAWNQHDAKEMLWTHRTRQIHSAHLTTFDQLWSTNPKQRPMLTIVEDTVKHKATSRGARSHDVLGTRCDSRLWEMLGMKNHSNCQDNLTKAIEPFGLNADYPHDAFNIFQATGIDRETDRYFIEESDAEKGDYVELFGEMDLIIAISACPAGSGGIELQNDLPTFPIGVTIYDSGVER